VKKTPHFTVTKINWLTLFKEKIAVYFEKPQEFHEYRELLIIEAGGTNS
jgi:hypothetical protein